MNLLNHRSMRRTLLLLAFLVGCEGAEGEVYGLLACIPVVGGLLVPDAGQATAEFLDGGAVDAAGFVFDAGVTVVAEGQRCDTAVGCEMGTECVPVGAASYCLRPCGAANVCTGENRRCDVVGGQEFCLPVVGRGERCERQACRTEDGLACLPARMEGASVLAYTCQLPCAVGSTDSCPSGESCLPNVVRMLDLEGDGGAVACDVSSCAADGGACPCAAGFQCMATTEGEVCARVQGACGTGVGPSDPSLLPIPSEWPAGGTCDPGAAQRYCTPLDGGAPVFCVQGATPSVDDQGAPLAGVEGLCIAVCRDPAAGSTQWPCPDGFACVSDPAQLFHVTTPDRVCGTARDCRADAGEQCVGPLPAYDLGYRCALPYGLCTPPSDDTGM